MRLTIKLSVLLLPLFTVAIAKAQTFGGNSPVIKWRQVNTPAARVIFPMGMDSAGIRVANIIARMNKVILPTIGLKQKQINILLQNQTTVPNGYVGLAPFRSEFYLTPEQNSFELGSLQWADQLAVHEFRHVQQYNNFNVGLSKGLHILFGEGGQAIGNELTVPNWFFEGDAVFNETYVTEQGRGRLPYFFNSYRALWQADKKYSWMKLRNGSYRDFIPDWYPMGYMLVSYGRERYGDLFWKNVTHDAAAFDGLFYPLQKAIKHYSGKDFKQFRADAFDYYKQQFGLEHPGRQSLRRATHFNADQEYPAYVDDHTVIYSKSTYNHAPVFVKLTDGKEQTIGLRDFSLDNYFAYHDGKIVYASYRPDVRWGNRNYSELNIVDVKTGHKTRLTKSTKYFSPDFSADGQKIITVQVSPQGKSELCILNLKGSLVSVIANNDNLFYTYPKFYGNKIISAVRNTGGKMSIALIDIATGKADYLLPFTFKPIAFPTVQKDKVYFSATSGKTDGLFALSLTDKKLYQLQNDSLKNSIGNYQPALSANKLAWVGLTASGYQVYQINTDQLNWQELPLNAIPGELPDFGITSLNKGDAINLLASVGNDKPQVSKYNKDFHLFNFHSLVPTVSGSNYSLALQGENVLNTLRSELLFSYNRNEGYKEFGASATYGALFPYLSAGVDYIVNREGFDTHNNSIFYNQLQYHGGFQIPLNLTRGHFSTSVNLGSDLVYSRNYFSDAFNTAANNRELLYLDNYLVFSTHIRKAKQNIYPRLGQNITLTYKNAINGVNANQFLAVGDFYFPGLLANHSLVISGATQHRDLADNGNFSNDIPFARGYSSQNMQHMHKIGVNYHFPIAYPDAGVANALYVLRIRGNLFYDYSFAADPIRIPQYTNFRNVDVPFASIGGEMFFDTQIWNELPLTFGIRYSHLLNNDIFGGTGSNRIELVLPLSIF